MKASRILAGLSAAAIAASMLSLVSVSADSTAVLSDEISYEWTASESNTTISVKALASSWDDLYALGDITLTATITPESGDATDCWAQIFGMDSDTWTWKSVSANFDETGALTITGNMADFNPDNNPNLGDAGIQFGTGAELGEGESVKGTIKYTVAIDKSAARKPEVKEEEPTTPDTPVDESELNLDVTVNPGEHDYAGDWGSDGSVPLSVWQAIDPNTPVQVTVNATRLEGFDYALMAPGSEHGWFKFYNEGKDNWQKDAITGVTLKSSLSKEEQDDLKEIVLQNDGYFVFPAEATDYTFTYTLSGAAVKKMLDDAEEEPADDGSLWGGMMNQVYGIRINSIQIKAKGTAPTVNTPTGNPGGTLNAYMMYAVSDWSQSTFPFDDNGNVQDTAMGVAIDGDGQYELSYSNVYDVFGTDATNNLNTLIFNIDIPAVYDGPNGTVDAEGNKYNDDNQRQLLYPNFAVTVDEILVDGQPVEFDASKFNFGNVENQTTNYRVELYNEYGSTKADPGIATATGGDNVTVKFTVSGMSEEPAEDTIVYDDGVFTLYETAEGTYYLKAGEEVIQDPVEIVSDKDIAEGGDYTEIAQVDLDMVGAEYFLGAIQQADGTTKYVIVAKAIVAPDPTPAESLGAVIPAEWPTVSQLNYSDPYDYIDTTSEDLFDYIKAIHDEDPDANVTFRFKATGTPEGLPIAAFLKVWEAATKPNGDPKLVKKGTNDWGKYVEVEQKDVELTFLGTIEKTVYEPTEDGTNSDGSTKYKKGEKVTIEVSEPGVYDSNGNRVDAKNPAYPADCYVTVKQKDLEKKANVTYYIVTYSDNAKYPEGYKFFVKNDDAKKAIEELIAENAAGGEIVDEFETEEKMEWHNYYITDEGLLNVQSTTDMAPGVTNNNRFSNLTAAEISRIKENNGIFYSDTQNGAYPYGHFIVFGDGETEKEYSFTLSASAIDQILDKSIRSAGGSLPYSINTWKGASAAMHGPIWLQTHEVGNLNDTRVYAETVVRTPDEIPYLYGKANYEAMYTPVSENKNGTTTTTTTTTTASSSTPASSSAAASDPNADTGAAAGFGIAGLLLAGAAMVCAKKKL